MTQYRIQKIVLVRPNDGAGDPGLARAYIEDRDDPAFTTHIDISAPDASYPIADIMSDVFCAGPLVPNDYGLTCE